MSEDDYITATNLAKLRIAYHVLRDVICLPGNGDEKLKAIMADLWLMIDHYEKKVDA